MASSRKLALSICSTLMIRKVLPNAVRKMASSPFRSSRLKMWMWSMPITSWSRMTTICPIHRAARWGCRTTTSSSCCTSRSFCAHADYGRRRAEIGSQSGSPVRKRPVNLLRCACLHCTAEVVNVRCVQAGHLGLIVPAPQQHGFVGVGLADEFFSLDGGENPSLQIKAFL